MSKTHLINEINNKLQELNLNIKVSIDNMNSKNNLEGLSLLKQTTINVTPSIQIFKDMKVNIQIYYNLKYSMIVINLDYFWSYLNGTKSRYEDIHDYIDNAWD